MAGYKHLLCRQPGSPASNIYRSSSDVYTHLARFLAFDTAAAVQFLRFRGHIFFDLGHRGTPPCWPAELIECFAQYFTTHEVEDDSSYNSTSDYSATPPSTAVRQRGPKPTSKRRRLVPPPPPFSVALEPPGCCHAELWDSSSDCNYAVSLLLHIPVPEGSNPPTLHDATFVVAERVWKIVVVPPGLTREKKPRFTTISAQAYTIIVSLPDTVEAGPVPAIVEKVITPVRFITVWYRWKPRPIPAAVPLVPGASYSLGILLSLSRRCGSAWFSSYAVVVAEDGSISYQRHALPSSSDSAATPSQPLQESSLSEASQPDGEATRNTQASNTIGNSHQSAPPASKEPAEPNWFEGIEDAPNGSVPPPFTPSSLLGPERNELE